MDHSPRSIPLTDDDVDDIDGSSSDPSLLASRYGITERVILAIHRARWVTRQELTGLDAVALDDLVVERMRAERAERERRLARQIDALRLRAARAHARARETVTRIDDRPSPSGILSAPRPRPRDA